MSQRHSNSSPCPPKGEKPAARQHKFVSGAGKERTNPLLVRHGGELKMGKELFLHLLSPGWALNEAKKCPDNFCGFLNSCVRIRSVACRSCCYGPRTATALRPVVKIRYEKMGPVPGRFELSNKHVEVNISNGSGI